MALQITLYRTGANNNHGYVVPSLDLVFVRLGDGKKFPDKDFEQQLVKKVMAATFSLVDKAARKGTLNVDIAEVTKNLLVGQGTVMAEVGDSVNDARWKISKGVSKAFAQYPPPAKK